MNYVYKTMASPIGELKLVASDAGLAAILWENDKPNRVKISTSIEDQNHPVLLQAEEELSEYFAGTRKSFDVALDFSGTAFQKEVWQELIRIPYGATRSYGELACRIGRPNASRAVGAANGKNPISIVAPCHRVVGVSGELTGFAGGLRAKAFLLRLESGQQQLEGTSKVSLRLLP